jgi:hypothetical protein
MALSTAFAAEPPTSIAGFIETLLTITQDLAVSLVVRWVDQENRLRRLSLPASDHSAGDLYFPFELP